MSALIVNYQHTERLQGLAPGKLHEHEQYRLLLLHEQQSIAFAILDPGGEVVVIREYQHTEQEHTGNFLRQVMTTDDYLQLPYEEVHTGIANKRISLVPRQIYDEAQATHFLENSAPVWTSDQVLTDRIHTDAIQLVYACRKSVLNTFRERWPNAQVHHSLSCYLQMLRKWANELPTGNHVFVNARHQSLYISLFRNDELVYSNVYDFSTMEDFLYYIILIYKEFQLDTATVPLMLTGRIDTGSRLYNLIYRYIGDIRFYTNENALIKTPEQYPPHLYFDLFSLHTCE